MESKNVVVAIALSLAVILFWEAFMTVPNKNIEAQKKQEVENKIKQDNDLAPSISSPEKNLIVSRKDSIQNVNRIQIKNPKVEGSISLKGGILDDLSFKQYKQTIEKKDNIIFLNPKETENGFFVETGWTSVGNKIKVPTIDTEWLIKGNKVLSPGNPITLEWNNNEGLVFRKKIEIDEKYLFKINQEIQNNTNQTVQLYPYSQMTRNKVPEDVMGFYILHEGFIGVFDGVLKEDDYDDIEDKKIVREADNGWLGITDKYWIAAIVPPKNENFKSTFVYKNAYKAN